MSKKRLRTSSYHAMVAYFAVGLKGSAAHNHAKTLDIGITELFRTAWERGWQARDRRRKRK